MYGESEDTRLYRGPTEETRKRRGWLAPLAIVLVVAGLVGLGTFFGTRLLEEKAAEARDLRRQLAQAESSRQALEARLGTLQAERDDLEAERAELAEERGELATKVQAHEEVIAELTEAREELESRFETEIAEGDVTVRGEGGELQVDLSNRIMFPSGSAELGDRGKEILGRVADSLRSLEDRVIRVAGHTDAMPISDALAEEFPSNWELSTARATNVVRFLQSEADIPGRRLVAVGYGQFRPAATNRSAWGRKRNRRIELKLERRP